MTQDITMEEMVQLREKLQERRNSFVQEEPIQEPKVKTPAKEVPDEVKVRQEAYFKELERRRNEPKRPLQLLPEHEDRLRRLTTQRMLGEDHHLAGVRLFDESTRKTTIVQRLAQEVENPCLFYLLTGGPGSGKTFGAVAFVAELPRGTAKFIHAYKLSQVVYRKEFKTLEALEEATYLIIDDIGAEPEGFRGADFIAHFDYLVDMRSSRNKTTIITTNMAVEAVKERYGERFVSRFRMSGKVIQTLDSDMRMEKHT